MTKNPLGVLILHGFPDNLECIRPIELTLRALELPIRTPLLRGHGDKSPESLRGVTWHEWFADAESALMDLLTECEKAIIVGYSMGGAITLILAAEHGDKLDSIILTAPAVQLTSPLAPGRRLNFLAPVFGKLFNKWDFPPDPTGLYKGSYSWVPMGAVLSFLDLTRAARRHLRDVKTPILMLHSRKDDIVSPETMNILENEISTPADSRRMVWFDKTSHDMFRDCERDAVIDVIVKYVYERINNG